MGCKKVFGLGFFRTGTTTLQTALEELGYGVIGMRSRDWSAYETGDFDALRRTVDQHDGFRDLPWPLLYEWLDRSYPDARFILTTRPTESWLQSCRNMYGSKPYGFFKPIFGFDTFVGNEGRAAEVYESHIVAVRQHFATQPDRYLEANFEGGDGWEKLCEFLGEPIPSRPFPHANLGAFTLAERIRRKVLKILWPQEYFRRVRDMR